MTLKQHIAAIRSALTKGSAYPLQRKAAQRSVLLWPRWKEQGAQWAMTDMTAYIEEGFNLNAVIYSAIMYKVRAAASAPLMAYTGERDHKEPAPPGHPLTRLLDRPNTYQSFLELDNEIRVYFNLFGNAYVWFRRPRPKAFPDEARALRPDCVRHLYKDGEMAGYVFIPPGGVIDDGFPLLPQDVMHVRLPNPGDPFAGAGKGLSPLGPLAQSADVDNAATAYLKQFFDYGAMPPGLLSFDVPMEDPDVAQARGRWMEVYGGSHNWTDVAVLDQGGKYQRLGLTFAELDMAGLDARNESRIAMCFGVPLTLIESRPVLVQSTYSNKEQDRAMFWEDTMIPELRMFEVEWLYYLTGPDGAFPAYDLGNVPALQTARNARADLLLRGAQASLVTRAEVKEALGLPYTDADNVYLLPFGVTLQPSGVIEAPVVSDEVDRSSAEDEDSAPKRAPPAPQTKTRKLTAEEKALIWKQIDGLATLHEKSATDAARKAFEVDRRNIRAIIRDGQKAALQSKATVVWTDMLIPVADYFKMAGADNWRKQFAPVFEAIVLSQGKQLNATFGMTFDVRNLLGEDWYRSYEMGFADPINATSEQEIRDLMSRAYAQGASVPDMEKALDTLFRQWTEPGGAGLTDAEREASLFADARLPAYRLENIARTETMRMSNAGANALYKDWGVEKQEWLATNDNRTRPEHAAASGQVRNIGQPFDVGSETLRYPGDPNGDPSQTCQCRCTILPVID